MTNDPVELCKEVLELDAMATKGPWKITRGDDDFREEFRVESFTSIIAGNSREPKLLKRENAKAIAHYRTSAPKLAKACQVMMLRLQDIIETQTFLGDKESFLEMECKETLDEVDKIMGEE
jgi:hypothetical protein